MDSMWGVGFSESSPCPGRTCIDNKSLCSGLLSVMEAGSALEMDAGHLTLIRVKEFFSEKAALEVGHYRITEERGGHPGGGERHVQRACGERGCGVQGAGVLLPQGQSPQMSLFLASLLQEDHWTGVQVVWSNHFPALAGSLWVAFD